MVASQLRELVLSNDKFTETDGLHLATIIIDDASAIAVLVNEFLADDMRFRQRCVWVFMALIKLDQKSLQPHLLKLHNTLLKTNEDSLKRNILRMFQFIELPKKLHGLTINYCFELLMDRKEPIAIHVFAMTVVFKYIAPYPELRNELKLILEDNIANGSAGYQSRAKKILQLLN